MTTTIDQLTHDQLTQTWSNPTGVVGWLTVLNHRAIGGRFIVTGFIFFLLGGVLALILRLQLATANNDLVGPDTYNQLFSMHGTTMMFLFAVPILEGFAIYLLPLMLGARDMPFPRLNAFGYYCFLFGGVLLYTSFLTGDAPDGGWFAYVPLTGGEFSPGVNIDYWLLGITLVEISAIAAAIEIIVLVFKFRAPGMTFSRMPLFAWNMIAVALAILIAFPPLIAGSILLESDRVFGTHFYNVELGGDPLLWQHLFWIFGHPEVYIIFLPAAGFVSMIVPTFSSRPIVGYAYLAMAAVVTAFLSFGLWVHHMFTTGLPHLAMAFFTAASMAIAIPAGLQVMAWIMTIWAGRPVHRVPLLFTLGFIFLFVLGGITGVMVAIVPFDLQAHDTYFVVAHFHYLLVGGMVFPLFGALHYWLPKMTGRLLKENQGQITFWLMFIGFNLTFFPMHITGLMGMPRRVYTYQDGLGWEMLNLMSTAGSLLLGVGVLVFVWNFVTSLRRGEPAGDNPWQAGTLEWATESPPAPYGFRSAPRVTSREPLWDQAMPFEAALPSHLHSEYVEARDGTRQLLMTSMMDAEPEGLFRLHGIAISPFIAAIGAAAIFVGVLTGVYVLSLAGGVIALAAVIAWHRPFQHEEPPPDSDQTAPPTALASLPAWLGLGFALTAAGAFMSSLFFAYFLLWSRAEQWPLGEIEAPRSLLPIAATPALLVATGIALLLRRRGPDAGVAWSAMSLLAGLAFILLLLVHLRSVDFNGVTNAYGSLYFVIIAVNMIIVVGVLAIIAWPPLRLILGFRTRVWGVSRENASLAAGFATLNWLLSLGILYAMPHLGAPGGEVRL